MAQIKTKSIKSKSKYKNVNINDALMVLNKYGKEWVPLEINLKKP